MAGNSIIKWILERKYGLITTVLFHMALIILILFIRIQQERVKEESIVIIDMDMLEEIRKLEIPKPKTPERLNSPARQARNIAVNQEEDKVEKYDDYKNYRVSNRTAEREAQKRVNQAVKDIIKENKLNPEDREIPATESKPIDFYKAEKIEEEQVYKGPTNIYYKLENRKVAYLPIPVYKCKGGATVQVDIRVGQRGKVELATINDAGTDTKDQCFLDAAKDAAKRTRFNFNTSTGLLQQGYIIYHFVAQ